jgi:glycosyltransferase involved in cell wall biosynthesis
MSYVLITAAKNEEKYLGDVINYVANQTLLPEAWFIVDDGSTDRTAEIIKQAAHANPFIHLIQRPPGPRDFGAQYRAIMHAWEVAKTTTSDFVGIVDADQAPFSPFYYDSIFKAFAKDPKIGMASGYIYERNPQGAWEVRKSNSLDSTCASAVFRRECFEAISGYTPLSLGGSDWLAQIEARRLGWKILVRSDLKILHYRATSSANGVLKGLWKSGQMDASFGSLTAFELLKCARRLNARPKLLGSAARLGGFLSYKLFKRPVITPEQVRQVRKEQAAKMRKWTKL